MAVLRALFCETATFNILYAPCLFRGKNLWSKKFLSQSIIQSINQDQTIFHKGFVIQETSHPLSLHVRPLSIQSTERFFTDLKSSPPSAFFLGFSGAIPFCGLAGMSVIFPEFMGSIVHAQQAYGACILSFLGAIHWGYALAEGSKPKPTWSTLGYSVSPSLIAWISLLLNPFPGLVTLCVGLAFALSKDLKTPYFPAWYYALRKALSTLAVTSLGFTAVVFYFY
ncbi:transmembrane protein 69-like [Montipora foliosa]|uniref:transmembrane protein 69-like n=1 Tax=Montipora foliosa TaxID=591990 RepID=UPI0035F1AE30